MVQQITIDLTVPMNQSRQWSEIAFEADKALLNFLAAMTAAPLVCTIFMKSLFNQVSSLMASFTDISLPLCAFTIP